MAGRVHTNKKTMKQQSFLKISRKRLSLKHSSIIFSALKHQLYHQQRIILAENVIALDIKEHLQEPVYRLLLIEEQLPAHLPSFSPGVIIVYLGPNLLQPQRID